MNRQFWRVMNVLCQAVGFSELVLGISTNNSVVSAIGGIVFTFNFSIMLFVWRRVQDEPNEKQNPNEVKQE